MQDVGAGLGADQEGRAELPGVGARGEHGGELSAAHESAGGDDRDLYGLADLGDQRDESDAGSVGLRVVPVGALVAARLDALDAHRVGAGPLGGLRLVRGGHGDGGEGADAGEGVEDVTARAAEGEGDDRYRVVEEDGELRVEAVVEAAVRVPELRVVPGGLTGELAGVDGDGRGSAYSDCGMKRLTPNGWLVSPRTCLISWYIPSAVLYPAARNPSPPASDTAAASCGQEAPPAMGACTIG